MDQVLINQLQFYTPPQVIKKILDNDKHCYQVAKHIIDREFRYKPQRWKTIAFPEYEDFFQAAISGFNPYKTSNGKDKGLMQAIQTYDPYKIQNNLPDDKKFLIETIGNTEQAICPFCKTRGEDVSLWPYSAGNETVFEDAAPDPVFHKSNKYCGRHVIADESNIELWLSQDLIRPSGKRYMCNYQSRLASIKNYISSQINYLVYDVRFAEYSNKRTLRKHAFYTCGNCSTLNSDFNTSVANKTEVIECTTCDEKIVLKDYPKKNITWQARGATTAISFSDSSPERDGRSTYDEIISNYSLKSIIDDPAVYNNNIEEEYCNLFDQLVTRIRELAASSLSKRQHTKLMKDPEVIKVDGIPETQNFQIFYEYFFIDDLKLKQEHSGRAKNAGDESSTYRDLAFKYLQKEQHYTQCGACSYKMYEPTESGKFKKLGHRTTCEKCNSTTVLYHGPKCGKPVGPNPMCTDHGDIDVVMYIFQTIEPKIRRLEQLVKNDSQAIEIKDRLKELLQAKDEMSAFEDMFKMLNY